MSKLNLFKSVSLAAIFTVGALSTTATFAYNGEPRVLPEQGVDVTNAVVKAHKDIYDGLLGDITSNNTLAVKPIVTLNPYGTAPLSAYVGFWNADTSHSFEVSVTSKNSTVPITLSHVYTPDTGANLLVVSGLEPDTLNTITVKERDENTPFSYTYVYYLQTEPLAPTDAEMIDGEYVISGTPIFDVKYSDSDFSKRSDGIYMTSYFGRGHYGLDNNGDVRWALTNDVIPSFNFNTVGDGHYVSNGSTVVDNVTRPATNKTIYEWDIMGRVYSVTNMQYEAHHTTVLVDGNSSQLLLASEKSDYNDGAELTREDGVSIIDRATGTEINYYDFSKLLDINRAPTIINGDGDNRNDWAHLNAAYNDATQELIIASLRNQNVFVGITPLDNADATISFIAGSHHEWSTELEQYLLTPVDADGKVLYNPEDTADIDKADKEFWTWGQHGVTPLPSSVKGIVRVAMFDDGNYRSYDPDLQLVAADNWGCYVEYTIDLSKMTITKDAEWGKELGGIFYSSYVGNVFRDPVNGNMLINSGGAMVDGNGIPTELDSGTGPLDLDVDPYTSESRPIFVEVQQNEDGSYTKLFELVATSGRVKTPDDGEGNTWRIDMSNFFVIKKDLYE